MPKVAPAKKAVVKQIAPSRHWCFTWNNFPDLTSSVVLLTQSMEMYGQYVFQHEVGESGTHHFQGYFCFNAKSRPSTLCLPKEIHWEKCRSVKHSIGYCSNPSKRFHSSHFWTTIRIPEPLVRMTYEELRPWQKAWANYLSVRADRWCRKIFWLYDYVGNFGKTTLAKYLIDNHHCLVTNGKAADSFNQLNTFIKDKGDGPHIVVFDVPRTSADYVSYQAIEKLKDGLVYSGKYEGGVCRFNTPHVICLANSLPDTSSMSEDRWEIIDLAAGQGAPPPPKQASPPPDDGVATCGSRWTLRLDEDGDLEIPTEDE